MRLLRNCSTHTSILYCFFSIGGWTPSSSLIFAVRICLICRFRDSDPCTFENFSRLHITLPEAYYIQCSTCWGCRLQFTAEQRCFVDCFLHVLFSFFIKRLIWKITLLFFYDFHILLFFFLFFIPSLSFVTEWT